MIAPLFRAFSVNGLTLRNRIVMAPMTRKRSPGGVPGADVAAYYRRRAECRVGLIVTEGTVVDHPSSAAEAAVPRFYGDDALAGWRKVVDGVHDAGGSIVAQLWHVGMMRPLAGAPTPAARPIGPSGIDGRGRVLTEPMSDADIAAVIAAFGQAAGDAQRLGFDGIELHAAHGYLVDQFFWHVTNRRDDRFGGDLGARTTFAADVVRACRRAVGDGWPILLRFSQWKLQDYAAKLATTPAELERLLTPLVDAGVDVFDCSTRYFWQTEFADSPLTLAGWTKKVTGLPVIAVGAVWQRGDFLTHGAASPVPPEQRLAQAAEMIERGEVDCLAVGRALLADPEWAIKIQCGQYDRIRPFSTAALADLS